MRGAWYMINFTDSCSRDDLYDVIEIFPALVRGTKYHMPPDASKIHLELLAELLAETLIMLQQQPTPDENIISAVEDLQNIVCDRLAVLAPHGTELGEFERQSAEDAPDPDLRSHEST